MIYKYILVIIISVITSIALVEYAANDEDDKK